MSQPAVKALDLPFELVYSDGVPLDGHRQRIQMNLLIHVIGQAMAARGREDFFAGGNMFVYYSVEQARDVAKGKRHFRGPAVFFVDHVAPKKEERKAWVAWEEDGRLPDLIVEILSPSTEKVDRRDKKKLYSQVFRTRDYFLYDLEGLLPLRPGHGEAGRLPSGGRPLSADPARCPGPAAQRGPRAGSRALAGDPGA
jgi:Uma2 family endonuclease